MADGFEVVERDGGESNGGVMHEMGSAEMAGVASGNSSDWEEKSEIKKIFEIIYIFLLIDLFSFELGKKRDGCNAELIVG